MEADAEAYEELSKPQFEAGSKFISELNLSRGAKVLDMGCGTGKITKYIADIVGSDGQVVGIDPDAARIKIAEEKYKEVSHLQFHVGSSVTGFPHNNEPYYDIHLSTAVFHWVPNEEKPSYIKKAYECLKLGGVLAIWCVEMTDQKNVFDFYPLSQDDYYKLFQDFGLFNNVVIERKCFPMSCKTFEIFKRWYKASTHQEIENLDPAVVKKFVVKEEDGTIVWNLPRVCITASKN